MNNCVSTLHTCALLLLKMRVASFDLGVRNLAWCVLTRPDQGSWPPTVTIHAWKLIDISGGSIKDLNSIDIATCVPLMSKTLKEHAADFEGVEHVFLEQQPVSRGGVSNIKTKVLSHICQSFFCALDIPVSFVSAKLKLSDMKEDAETYKERKKLAIKRTSEGMLVVGGEWRTWWEARHGKRDDLADAFLQGCMANVPTVKVKRPRKKLKVETPIPDILELE